MNYDLMSVRPKVERDIAKIEMECARIEHERDVALAEVAALREAMAAEARIILAQALDVKALGKNRRRILREQVIRMAGVALGTERPRQIAHRHEGLDSWVQRLITAELPDEEDR